MPILRAFKKLVHGEEVMKFKVGGTSVSVKEHFLAPHTIQIGEGSIKATILKDKGVLHISIDKHRRTKYIPEHLGKLPTVLEKIAERHKTSEIKVSVPTSLLHIFEKKGWKKDREVRFSRNPFTSIPLSDFVVLSKKLKGR